jgi:hypothetical protein
MQCSSREGLLSFAGFNNRYVKIEPSSWAFGKVMIKICDLQSNQLQKAICAQGNSSHSFLLDDQRTKESRLSADVQSMSSNEQQSITTQQNDEPNNAESSNINEHFLE